MEKVKELFISEYNANYILLESIKYVYDKIGVTINKNDSNFHNICNIVASNVYKYHEKNKLLISTNIIDTVNKLNHIVIDEIADYYSATVRGKQEHPIENGISDSSDKTETIKISMKTDKHKISIKNVNQIKVVKFSMYNNDYLINDTNNKLVIELCEQYSIKLEQGNYTRDQFVTELQTKLRDITSNPNFNCIINNFDDKITISLTVPFKIIKKKSTILDVLGFINSDSDSELISQTGDNPVKLIKKNSINLGITCLSNKQPVYQFIEPIMLQNDYAIYDIEHVKKFKPSINIDEISLEFDNYNHRSYPYNLILQIKYGI